MRLGNSQQYLNSQREETLLWNNRIEALGAKRTRIVTGPSKPLITGDPEREAEAIRSKEGIPLLKPVVDDLLEISQKTGIPSANSRAARFRPIGLT